MTVGPEISLLDCTLRDGGYYCDWDFDTSDAQSYINNIADSGVTYIELGFRFATSNKFLGPFAYTTEGFLKTLVLPKGVDFGVMINATDFLKEDSHDLLEKNFTPCSESPINLIRIAAHFEQVLDCAKLVKHFKKLGYKVGLNIMQISRVSDDEVTSIVKSVEESFVEFEALYFADSLGNMRMKDVTRVVSLMKSETKKAIGFHGHDNIGLGVSNSLAAIEAGATWVDATVTGMGRGAGNTQTEYLAIELVRRNLMDLKCTYINQAATGWLAAMQSHYKWGSNLYYYDAALRGLHPTYVQAIISSGRFNPGDIMSVIEILGNSDAPSSYKEANIDAAFSDCLISAEGTTKVAERWAGRPVVVVGGDPAAERHWPAVKEYAKKKDALIISANFVNYLNPSEIDGVACIHPARLVGLLQNQDYVNVALYTSLKSIHKDLLPILHSRSEINDYGVKVVTDTFEAFGTGCLIPQAQVTAYIVALAQDSGASEIMLAGFSGYDGKSDSFKSADSVIEILKAKADIPITSLTPTNYNLHIRSIYGV